MPSFAVLVGILLNNARLNDLNQRLVELRSDMVEHFGDMRSGITQRFASLENRLDLMLGKLRDLDTRRRARRSAHSEKSISGERDDAPPRTE